MWFGVDRRVQLLGEKAHDGTVVHKDMEVVLLGNSMKGLVLYVVHMAHMVVGMVGKD